MYGKFAAVYDRLIKKDINYSHIADFLENLFDSYGKNPNLVCDLASGSGNITIPMAMRGYDMIAVDSSCDMLNLARQKAADNGLDILFLNQDMTKLDLFGTCDAFLCMIDGFNYIMSLEKLKEIFSRIRTCFIENDGIFVFDISSKYKLKSVLGNNTFIYDTEDIFYTWENSFKKGLCRMDLSFFIKDKHGKYKRINERQIQRSYSAEEITSALKEAGFSHVDVYGGFDFKKPCAHDERLVFAALA